MVNSSLVRTFGDQLIYYDNKPNRLSVKLAKQICYLFLVVASIRA